MKNFIGNRSIQVREKSVLGPEIEYTPGLNKERLVPKKLFFCCFCKKTIREGISPAS